MQASPIPQETLTHLYFSGNSMSDIAKQLHCSVNKVVYWMEKYNIKRRTWSEATYVKRNPQGDPFIIKQEQTISNAILYGLGLGIYWGEGEKVSKHQLRVANTDPEIIKTFIKFLLSICQLKRDKLCFSIVCFNDTDPEKARLYWAKQLTTSEEKFGKIVQIPPQGKGNYRRKSQHGVCTVSVGNMKLKSWIMEELGKLADIV